MCTTNQTFHFFHDLDARVETCLSRVGQRPSCLVLSQVSLPVPFGLCPPSLWVGSVSACDGPIRGLAVQWWFSPWHPLNEASQQHRVARLV